MKTQTAKHLITLCVSDWPEEHAKVEFICKAVNEHDTLIAQRDALLEACQRIDQELTGAISVAVIDNDKAKQITLSGVRSIARTAIALCEPKEKEMV